MSLTTTTTSASSLTSASSASQTSSANGDGMVNNGSGLHPSTSYFITAAILLGVAVMLGTFSRRRHMYTLRRGTVLPPPIVPQRVARPPPKRPVFYERYFRDAVTTTWTDTTPLSATLISASDPLADSDDLSIEESKHPEPPDKLEISVMIAMPSPSRRHNGPTQAPLAPASGRLGRPAERDDSCGFLPEYQIGVTSLSLQAEWIANS
ncbi:hypothetical protein CVT26_005996 [Gymnopilus dilepis]|uniref:Uncharacterized protein n=1 Tax=Gymnopilus dilepis TaxID=231916 RepID=A0A409Y1E1_9AGAR|nr:hypothetical protein CVT26_005996 [Gymnopilus dilepis]